MWVDLGSGEPVNGSFLVLFISQEKKKKRVARCHVKGVTIQNWTFSRSLNMIFLKAKIMTLNMKDNVARCFNCHFSSEAQNL